MSSMMVVMSSMMVVAVGRAICAPHHRVDARRLRRIRPRSPASVRARNHGRPCPGGSRLAGPPNGQQASGTREREEAYAAVRLRRDSASWVSFASAPFSSESVCSRTSAQSVRPSSFAHAISEP